MSPDQVFVVFNGAVAVPWLLLVFAPRWAWTQRIVHAIWIPLVYAAGYLWVAIESPGAPEGGSFGSLQGVMLFFTSPYVALAGWIHYLIFDLFVGAWEVRDAERRGIAHAWVIPCLLLTLMAGPLGLGAYLLLRYWLVRATGLDDGAESAS